MCAVCAYFDAFQLSEGPARWILNLVCVYFRADFCVRLLLGRKKGSSFDLFNLRHDLLSLSLMHDLTRRYKSRATY